MQWDLARQVPSKIRDFLECTRSKGEMSLTAVLVQCSSVPSVSAVGRFAYTENFCTAPMSLLAMATELWSRIPLGSGGAAGRRTSLRGAPAVPAAPSSNSDNLERLDNLTNPERV